MIKIKSIDGNPEIEPPVGCGSHFDGEYYYYFDNIEEHNEFLASLPQVEEVPIAQISPVIEAILNASPEEIELIKQILNSK